MLKRINSILLGRSSSSTQGDDTVAKYTQGGTPFYEMYSNENPYRKLTVDCYYPRPQTFIITTSDGYYGKLFVVMGGNNLGGAVVRVITEKGTAPFEIKYGNVQALSGSGHYSVDVFIHKKSSIPVVLNIKPYIQGISSFTKVYTADDFVVSTADDFTNATKTATISTEYTTVNDSSTSSGITAWSAKKLESLLLTSKNIVNSSGTIINQSVDFDTEYLQALTNLGCTYFIRNGICHVRFGFKILKDFTDIEPFELPGGNVRIFCKTIPSKTNPERAIELVFFYGGVQFLNGVAGDEYYLMFSYPIA